MNEIKGKYKKINLLSWCKHCNQGWVCIVKDINSGKLYCECGEDFTLWTSPEDYENGVYLPDNRLSGKVKLVNASEEEIILQGWHNPINKVCTCSVCFCTTRPNEGNEYPSLIRNHGWVVIKK